MDYYHDAPAPDEAREADDGRSLRARAQEAVALSEGERTGRGDPVHLAYELQVHQVELAMQNEELRRNQATLAQTLADYRDLYENAPVGYLTLDPGGRCLTANRAAVAMLGVARTQLVGRPLQAILSTDEADRLTRHLGSVLASEAGLSTQLSIHNRGHDVHVRLDSIAIQDERGPCFRTSLTDVSDRHRLLEELRELNRNLERHVQDRTAALARTTASLERELEAREKAEQELLRARKLEAVGRLAGGIAHDFNNLLATIRLGLPYAIQPAPRGPEVTRCVEDIEVAIDRASALTSKLLAFARCEVVRPVVLDVSQLVTRYEPTLRHAVRSDITLEVSLPGAAWVSIDPGSLERVLLNLVLNARDAIEGSGRLSISVQTVEVAAAHRGDAVPGAYARLRVADDGAGMTDEQLERIFEPFYTSKDPVRGHGLGLATVHGIVAAAGGFIEVDSDAGRGTVMDVFLPGLKAPDRMEARPTVEVSPGSGDETVLVVDDQSAVRRALSRVLRSAGYVVHGASSGAEALDKIAAQPGTIELVIADVIMPGMSGVELAREVGARYPSLPVVLMSGHAAPAMVGTSYPYLKKPFSPEQACRLAREALDAAVTVRRGRS